jgi:hypothetical protein
VVITSSQLVSSVVFTTSPLVASVDFSLVWLNSGRVLIDQIFVEGDFDQGFNLISEFSISKNLEYDCIFTPIFETVNFDKNLLIARLVFYTRFECSFGEDKSLR